MDRLSTRAAFFSIMASGLLIYSYYSASIVSTRLNDQIFKINDSLVELGKLNLQMSSEKLQYFEILLKVSIFFQSNESIISLIIFIFQSPEYETKKFYAEWWSKIPANNYFVDPEVAIKLVQQGGYAYHTHPDVGYPIISRYFSNQEVCELTEVHLARPTFNGFAVKHNSTFVEMFRIG